MPDLSILIPALREPENIRRLLPWIRSTLGGIAHEVIVVVASGEDPTCAEAEKEGARVVIQGAPGYGGALRAGFGEARGEFVVTMDADLSHEPTFIRDLWARRDEGDVVIASRYVPFGLADMPLMRRILSAVLNIFFRVALDLPVRDLSSGFRLYRRSFLDRIRTRGRDFDVLEEILILACAGGWRIQEVPFHYRPRWEGRSHAKLIKFGISYIRTTLRYWRMRNSLRSADHDAKAFRSRNPLQRGWHRKRYRLLLGHLQGKERILDLGPSSSLLAVALPQSVTMDVGLKRVRHLRWLDRRVVRSDGVPFLPGSFDAIVCSQVIEHLESADGLLDGLREALRDGGILIVGIHDWRSITWKVVERVRRWVLGPDEDRHYRRMSVREIREGMGGMKVVGEDRIPGWERILILEKES